MDDRIRGEFKPRRGQPQSGSDEPRKRNSKAGDFKISIDYDGYNSQDFGGTKDYFPSERTTAPSRPESGKFQVSIPESEKISTQRPTSRYQSERPSSQKSTSSARPTSGASASRPSQTTRPTAGSSASRPTASQNRRPAANTTRPTSARTAANANSGRSASGRPSAAAAKARAKRKLDKKKRFKTICICLAAIALITTFASYVALSTINDILAINKESTEAVSVVIPEGAQFKEVFNALADNGLIKQKFICRLFCKFRDYDTYSYTDKETKEKKTAKVEYVAGVYYFDTDEGLETMLESVKASRQVSKDTVRVTFPEGWTIAQIFQKIEKYNICTAEKLYANLEIVGKQFGFYESIPANSGRYLKAEGYLFPDTYDFYIGESANSVLKKLFSNFESKWTEEFDQKLKESGMTKDQIIIIASILQREAKDKTQMAAISSVLYNRLKPGSGYPNLQLNSSKDYITSVNELGVFSDFYYTLYLDSYNTYSNEGLPPGALCNPGIDAIKAALSPADTNYYFFCHDKSGSIYLATTAAEHAVNTRKIFNESN